MTDSQAVLNTIEARVPPILPIKYREFDSWCCHCHQRVVKRPVGNGSWASFDGDRQHTCPERREG